jgi:hypothetical protein
MALHVTTNQLINWQDSEADRKTKYKGTNVNEQINIYYLSNESLVSSTKVNMSNS